MIEPQLNGAFSQEKNKQSFQVLREVQLFNDPESPDSLIESSKLKLNEENLKNDLRKPLEHKDQKGTNDV